MIDLALIVNAHSGKKETQRQKLLALAKELSIPFSLTQSLDDLDRALKTYAMLGAKALIIYGGDGTVDAVITIIREQRIFAEEPALILLHGGTTNMTIRDLGLKAKKIKHVKRVLKNLNALKTTPRSPFKIEAKSLNQPVYGFFFGMGAIPRVIDYAKGKVHTKGFTGPVGESFLLMTVLKKLFMGQVANDDLLSPSTISISNDQTATKGECIFSLATTLESLVLGVNPATPRNDIGVMSLAYPYQNLWRNKAGLLNGQNTVDENTGIWRAHGERFEIEMNGPWTMDGEMFEAKHETLTLTLEPPIRFLQD